MVADSASLGSGPHAATPHLTFHISARPNQLWLVARRGCKATKPCIRILHPLEPNQIMTVRVKIFEKIGEGTVGRQQLQLPPLPPWQCVVW